MCWMVSGRSSVVDEVVDLGDNRSVFDSSRLRSPFHLNIWEQFSNETSTTSPGQNCECYKKLSLLGVPLYISEEDEAYSENQEIYFYDKAFSLPGILKIDDNILEYPLVEGNELSAVFNQMAQVISNVSDFELNLLSFWILDMFIEGLNTAQCAGFPHEHQKATLLWIAYFFNYIQKNNPSRKEMFKHLKEILFLPEEHKFSEDSDSNEELPGEHDSKKVSEEQKNEISPAVGKKIWELPLPPHISEWKDETISEEIFSTDELTSEFTDPGETLYSSLYSATEIKKKETISDTNLKHMKIILEILYRIFGNLWVFMEMQIAFHTMPSIDKVELPFNLNVPKPKLKSEQVHQSKTEKIGRKSFEKAQDKSMNDNDFEKNLHKNDYLLPLQAAEEAKLLTKHLFSQPTSDRSVLGKGRKK